MKIDDQTQHGASERSDLPFVRADGHGETNCWAVNPSGDAEQDFETGSRYGRQAVAFAEQAEDTTEFLIHVFRDMVAVGQFGNLEVGFVDTVSHAALLHYFSLRCPRPNRSL